MNKMNMKKPLGFIAFVLATSSAKAVNTVENGINMDKQDLICGAIFGLIVGIAIFKIGESIGRLKD